MKVTDRESVAERLLRSSLEHSYEPAIDVDWDADLVAGLYGISPERCSLYGTDLWDGLTEEQKVTLSIHEICSIAQVGLWFEMILMQMLLRYSYDRDPRTGHVQYALTEIADECRHSIMFAKLAARFDVPDYRPGALVHALGGLFAATAGGAAMFASVLVAEETLDQLQRESMRDERVQPLSRMVNRIHVTEEARHVRWAREELARLMPRLTDRQRRVAQTLTPVVSFVVIRSLIHPGVYASVGLDPATARRAALANPHHRASIAWSARKLMPFLREVGIVGGPLTRLWRCANLIDRTD
ncbi:AurF N-oxygenase family protein [Pseudonocardia abyssalis]|uniref:Diiron oxygenase n=1 Tax=Pseudonocardia abyssalis TaxID=2792008 RepID=A0ABS6UVX3_9PSEU|nr:diiron oxygenase [Pseudonocardia abyssalis]MBW0118697.1 diiron oxygenase [Pseudonocardia abyssalis]MBW0136395.1 diiron oxygenase [Pseudonocardia abyssalis]